jgi:hypothetical protein
MKGFRWLGKTGRAIGKGVTYPIRKVGQQAGKGAVEGARTEIAKTLSDPTPFDPVGAQTKASRWITTIKLIAQIVKTWRGR